MIAARTMVALAGGYNQHAIARNINISLCSMQRVWQQYQDTGLLTRRPGSVTADSCLNHLQEGKNVNISEWTVRKRFHTAGLSSQTIASGLPSLVNTELLDLIFRYTLGTDNGKLE